MVRFKHGANAYAQGKPVVATKCAVIDLSSGHMYDNPRTGFQKEGRVQLHGIPNKVEKKRLFEVAHKHSGFKTDMRGGGGQEHEEGQEENVVRRQRRVWRGRKVLLSGMQTGKGPKNVKPFVSSFQSKEVWERRGSKQAPIVRLLWGRPFRPFPALPAVTTCRWARPTIKRGRREDKGAPTTLYECPGCLFSAQSSEGWPLSTKETSLG